MGVENIVGKGENAVYQHFLVFHNVFKGLLGIVWKRVYNVVLPRNYIAGWSELEIFFICELFPKQALDFTWKQYRSFEITMEENDNCLLEQFFFFLECFLPVWRTFCKFHQI